MFNIRALVGSSLRATSIAVLILITLISPSFAFAQVATTTNITATSSALTTPAVVPIDPHNQADVSRAVAEYFADIPVMYEIAKCESNFTQYNPSGTVLNGGSGGMLGVFQINGSVHKTFALSLNDDITTLQGNMAYARYLYQSDGTDPWISSEPCWGGIDAASAVASILGTAANKVVSALTPEIASASTSVSTTAAVVPAATTTTSVSAMAPIINDMPKASAALTTNLKLGSTGSQVLVLQKLLNSAGYKIAKSGPGSSGQETNSFGGLTKAAVQRFQCAQGIVCKGTESSTGYGYVGAKTRAALLASV